MSEQLTDQVLVERVQKGDQKAFNLLVVRYQQDGQPAERLIPFVDAYVDAVDLDGKRITVDWQPDY